MQALAARWRLRCASCCCASRAAASPATPTSSCPRRGRTATPASSSWSRPSIRPCPARTRSARRPSCSRRACSRCASPRRSCGSRRRAASSRPGRRCRDGRCESVEFTNVACFADRLDAPLEVEGLGTIAVDVAYGGMWYAIADAARARLRDRAGRGARPLARRRADPRGGARAAAVRPSREPRDRRRQHRPDRRALAGRRRGQPQRRRRRAGPARPLGHRHRPLGAARRAARAWADGRRRRDDPRLGDRLDLRRPDRRRGDASAGARRSCRRSAAAPGSPASTQLYRRSRRPLPRGLPARPTPGASAGSTARPDGGARSSAPRRSPQDNGTVVSANAACSGTSKRATPAAFVVTVPAIEFVPSPLAFQTASVERRVLR